MGRPVLIIVNGLPGGGKTTLAKRLADDLRLPVFSRDGIYETLFETLAAETQEASPLLGSAAYRLLYAISGSILTAGRALIVEGFFGRPDLRTAEFLDLQRQHDFEPLQILCKADGNVLVGRFLARAGSAGRHSGHTDADKAWLEQNRERLLRGQLEPLALGGQLIEVDTSAGDSRDYAALLRQIEAVLAEMA
ncbi:MAG: AAA family ATPase [Chloroflexi bacterium]|nr:AAA family ATPase [Chloroflexota bacterium]